MSGTYGCAIAQAGQAAQDIVNWTWDLINVRLKLPCLKALNLIKPFRQGYYDYDLGASGLRGTFDFMPLPPCIIQFVQVKYFKPFIG